MGDSSIVFPNLFNLTVIGVFNVKQLKTWRGSPATRLRDCPSSSSKPKAFPDKHLLTIIVGWTHPTNRAETQGTRHGTQRSDYTCPFRIRLFHLRHARVILTIIKLLILTAKLIPFLFVYKLSWTSAGSGELIDDCDPKLTEILTHGDRSDPGLMGLAKLSIRLH